MKYFPAKYPEVFRWLYPQRLSLQNAPKTIYLTFDDGPVPDITPWVLDQLGQYNAKATFLCIGENIRKHPQIFKEIVSRGHSLGNHTYNHLNGWKTSLDKYLENVALAEEIMRVESGPDSYREWKVENGKSGEWRVESGESGRTKIAQRTTKHSPQTNNHKLFRPPFGKIRNNQARELAKRGYKIVMWDVLSWDFREDIGEEKCLENVINNAEEGSIIVFHDSRKAAKNLKAVLPKILDYYSQKEFQFNAL